MSKRKLSVEEMQRTITETPEATAKLKRLQETIELAARQLTRHYVIPTGEGNTVRFAAIGDTHIGSLYARVDAFEAFCHQAASEGYTTVLHAGDVLDGWSMYKGQEFELRDHGFDAQRERFVNEAPRINGMEFHFITGNHDDSFRKLVGMEVGPALQERRPDWKCVGFNSGLVTLQSPSGRELKIELVHPSGGSAYALSYKPQKYVESISGGTKPDVVIMGHFHKAEMIPQYRNVVCFQVGCFQSQTPNYMKPKGLAAHVGGWLIEVVIGEHAGMSHRVKAEFVGFYEGV